MDQPGRPARATRGRWVRSPNAPRTRSTASPSARKPTSPARAAFSTRPSGSRTITRATTGFCSSSFSIRTSRSTSSRSTSICTATPGTARSTTGRTMASSRTTPKAIEHIRKCYAALLTMTDHWLGKLWDKLDEHGLWDDTMVVLTTDHGTMLGEHRLLDEEHDAGLQRDRADSPDRAPAGLGSGGHPRLAP